MLFVNLKNIIPHYLFTGEIDGKMISWKLYLRPIFRSFADERNAQFRSKAIFT